MSKKIAIGGDHAGYEYKEKILKKLTSMGYDVKDFGPTGPGSVDYPDYAHPLAVSVAERQTEFGILICGSGNGVAMAANKHAAIRAGLCWNKALAELARQHNDANVLCLPARFIPYDQAEEIVEAFINTEFEGGRHQRRVDKISGE